ncbi:MAG: radical SAM protein [Verrucomicrobia bacterium]|nr:radical SAM protein [Verrucomicrobiota bacterium]
MTSGRCKILLLHPPFTLKAENIAEFGVFPPLGLAYLAGVLLDGGYDVEICDLLVQGADHLEDVGGGMTRVGVGQTEIERILREKDPRIVGITNNFTAFSADAVELARLTRNCLPATLIVMGGAHASMATAELLSTGVVDVIVSGEGEFIFRELTAAVSAGDLEGARRVRGTKWAVDGRVIDNGIAEPIADLDIIPPPAYHLLPMERYIWQRKANFATVIRRPVGHMITSRGCRYNCIFCSTKKHFRRLRTRSAANILQEIKLLMRDYGVREIHFHDDSMMSEPEHVRRLCEAILQERLDIRWQVSQGINCARLDEDLLEIMHRSGMYRVGFPIESGSPDTLRFIRKPIQLEKVKKLIEKCNRLGLYCFGCFMIGFPEETRVQIEQTRDFIVHSGLDYAKISITQPLVGSDLYDIFEELGLCKGVDRRGSSYLHTNYDTVHFTADELNRMRDEMMRMFARQRIKNIFQAGGFSRCILPKLRSLEGILYFLKVGWLALRGI